MKICWKWDQGRRRFLRFWIGGSLGGMFLNRLGASENALTPCYFNVPEGDATQTLKLAVKQAKAEILLSAGLLEGVRTRKVRGMFVPLVAFNFMLEKTALKVVRHQESGVYAIKTDRHSKESVRRSGKVLADGSDAK